MVLFEDVSHDRIVAQCRLPFIFQFVADFPLQCARPPLAGTKRTRHQIYEELDEIPPGVYHRNVRRRFNETLQRDMGGERANHLMPAVNPWGTTQGGGYHNNSPSSPSSLSITLPQSPQVVHTNNADPQGRPRLHPMVPELI